MTRRSGWIWVACGAAGVAVLVGRRRNARLGMLGSPIQSSHAPTATKHGEYGAHRKGPPAHAHQGVDLAARAGSRVLAVGDGVIVHANPGLGKIVRKLRLDEPAPFAPGGQAIAVVVYADLGSPLVEPGDRVRKGDAVAVVGREGFVHFAVKTIANGQETFIDPERAGFAYERAGQEVA